MSPSQRTLKAQSLPVVPSVMHVFARQPQQSPTRHATTPPQNPPGTDPAGHPALGYPRPINRIAPPFLAAFHAMEENWQMTDELMKEIERADYAQTLTQHPPAPGTAGVAYAGGAQSGPVYVREAPSPHKDTVLNRVRAGEHAVPQDAPPAARRPTRDPQPGDSGQPRTRPLPASPGSSPPTHAQARAPSPDRLSPPYHTPQGSSGESAPAGDYVSSKRDYPPSSLSSPAHTRIPTPPTAQRRSSNATSENTRATPPATSRLANQTQTPPLQAMKTRTPDKSLPVQEELEDDVAASIKEHPSDPPREDDDDTLIETETGYIRQPHDMDRDADSASYTPRSPSVTLPETFPPRHYANHRLASLTKHHRNGSTDQLGLRSVDAVVNAKPQQDRREWHTIVTQQVAEQPQEDALPRQQNRTFNDDRANRGPEPSPSLSPIPPSIPRPHPLQTQHIQRDDSTYDDPAAAYLQMYFTSTRPNAPIPPTPHSQTAAPSPSPFVSSIQPSPAPHAGSPYPYPFTHVRRNPYSAVNFPTAPSTTYDPNAPSVIEEQLALQMQLYALNNHHAAGMSDATLSPSATPFPGAGYNPWAFIQASRAFSGRRFDSMSLQSSPSHQPVSLPSYPSQRGRGRGIKRREKTSNLREGTSGSSGTQKNPPVQPPPRVESTQPRDTTPEPYSDSGEETAGEAEYDVHEEPAWVGDGDEEAGEWIDEQGSTDELAELEYHPSFIAQPERRRRTWDARWDALQRAFEALDCETDATMVLLAAPSHTTALHALTSRAVRRDGLLASPAMRQMRTAFRGIAARRHAARSQPRHALLARLHHSASSGDGETREAALARALETALASLDQLRGMYAARVLRWEEEMARVADERDSVEVLLRQTIGVGLGGMQPCVGSAPMQTQVNGV